MIGYIDAGDYRCRQCGEIFPLMLASSMPVAIGGVTAPRFVRHGPGCTGQVFDNVKVLRSQQEGESNG